MFDVVLLMAGSGSRSGLSDNKVFYEVDDMPLYMYSLNAFLKLQDCRKVILVIRDEDYDRVAHLASSRISIVNGGKLRQDSVYNGVNQAQEGIILVHDAARANIKKEDILKVYDLVKTNRLVFLASPVSDTIKYCQKGKTTQTLNRDQLYAAQTPQAFYKEDYLLAYDLAQADNFLAYDDCHLLEVYAKLASVKAIGSSDNLKVTNPSDLLIIKHLLSEGD